MKILAVLMMLPFVAIVAGRLACHRAGPRWLADDPSGGTRHRLDLCCGAHVRLWPVVSRRWGVFPMMRKPPPPIEERCPRPRCIRRRAVVEGKLLDVCAAHFAKKPLLNARRDPGGSGPEKARRAELQLLYAAGKITKPREQVPYPMVVNGVLVLTWHADFQYEDLATGELVVEDTKAGLISDRHVLCMKLMKACHGITVRELDMRTGAARNRKVRRIR